MLTVNLGCPCCSSNLRYRRLIAPGEQLRCPHCGSWFRAGNFGKTGASLFQHRGSGILWAWLLFAVLLLGFGGSIAFLLAIGKRSRPLEAEPVGWVESSRPAGDRMVGLEDSTHPTVTTTRSTPQAPAVPPSKPTPAPVSSRNSPADPPKPPPLPEPRRRPREQATPAKDKPTEPSKTRDSDGQEAPKFHWLPPNIQKQVDRSVDKGVEFLRRRQNADGSWGHQSGVAGNRFTSGITALSALTLLECGVPTKDAHVRSAARYLRKRVPELTSTYSISLAILFFDRLGDEADAANIRTLALRLVAGQKPSGGWDYSCPKLTADEELGLLALLYKDRPTTPADLFALERRPETKLDSELYRPCPSKVPPLELFVGRDPLSALPASRSKAEAESDRTERKNDPVLPGDPRRLSKRALEAADKLPEALRRTPALRSAELLRETPDLQASRTDNSNTQFAILGLLTAENYDVPMERAIALLDWRFRNSMTVQGGWNYQPNWSTTPSMTAAALMGLALKHGLLLPNRRGRGRNVVVHDDEIMHRGFLSLTGMLENYYAGFAFNQVPLEKLDLYCLWTVERVAVLYNLHELGSLEWYPAGVQLLLPSQRTDGSWTTQGTKCLKEPSVSSSFALLFLKRSNLARGLTKRLSAPEDIRGD
jgi:hypothetical protein